jgi:excisionase family DNA binding protein
MPDKDRPMNAREAAELIGAHVETVRRLARRGKIPSYKVGKDWRFRREALLAWANGGTFNSAKPKVLVVDDDPTLCDVVSRILEGAGYRVATALSGAEALLMMQAGMPDAVILDLVMPGIDGVTILQWMKERVGRVPVVVYTGYPDSVLMERAMQLTPVLLLAKPAPAAQLIEAVERVVGKYNNEVQKQLE